MPVKSEADIATEVERLKADSAALAKQAAVVGIADADKAALRARITANTHTMLALEWVVQPPSA